MKIVIAIDSLKGSLSSIEAGNIIKKAINNVMIDANVIIKPLADGGEGTIESLTQGNNGKKIEIVVKNPLNKDIKAVYGILEDGKTAIIEMAQASGLTLIKGSERNPLYTTTYGVGQIIKDAINKGCREFIVGIGGSATNDAGVGMLQALGFEFYDAKNNKLGLGGEILEKISNISTKNKIPYLDECTFKIACDVNNPLYGENGASYIYASQKGANKEEVKRLDDGLKNFDKIVKTILKKDISNTEGAGAAGGLGFGFLVFLNSTLQSGIKIILEKINLEDEIKDADIVVTGEGRIDKQTAMGKAPIGVAKLAKKYNAKVIALAGCISNDATKCNDEGIDAYFSIINRATTLDEAMNIENATKNLFDTTTQIFNLIKSL